MPEAIQLNLAASTLGQLYERPLAAAVDALSRAGYDLVEVAAAPPHLALSEADGNVRRKIARIIAGAGCRCATVSTFSLDPLSPYPAVAENAAQQVRSAVELAHDLEAPFVVLTGGRRFSLLPAPLVDCTAQLKRMIEPLLPLGERLGVGLALENAPFGFLETADSLADFVDMIDDPNLGITYDAANAIVVEDPVAGVASVAHRLCVAHVSGSSRQDWAHTSVRGGEVNLRSFAAALVAAKFKGVTVYEFLDGRDPVARLAEDLPLLREHGWIARSS